MGKPGVMFYFDVRPSLTLLTREEKGDLFEAILDYGQYGVVPELNERLVLIWGFIQSRLDRDSERYGQVVVRNGYARYARQMNRLGEQKLSFDQWKLQMPPQQPEVLSEVQWTSSENQWTSSENQWTSSENQWTSSGSQLQSQLQSQQQSQQQTQTQKQIQKQGQTQTQGADMGPSATPPVFHPPDRDAVLAYCREKGYRMDVDGFMDYYTANGWRVGRSPMKDWQAALRRWHRKETGNGETELPADWNVGTTL